MKKIAYLVCVMSVALSGTSFAAKVVHLSAGRGAVNVSFSSGKQLLSSVGGGFSAQTLSAVEIDTKEQRQLSMGSGEATLSTSNLIKPGLRPNHPNPFNPTTTIRYAIGQQAHVSVRIYNVVGQLVRTLVSETRPAGVVHGIVWDGRNDRGLPAPSGVYFSQLETKNLKQTRKMILLK